MSEVTIPIALSCGTSRLYPRGNGRRRRRRTHRGRSTVATRECRCALSLSESEDPFARRARPHERDRNGERSLDEGDVRLSLRRKGVPDLHAPARKLREHGTAMVEVALMRRELLRLRAVRQAVAHADRKLVELGEDVELCQRERRDPVDAHGEPERDEVEPAAAALAARDRAELPADV